MAIYRGAGGAGDSNTDATLLEVTEQAVIATTKASDAAASASAASTSETNAATSATASASSATAAASSASGITASVTAAANSATAAANSATASATAETNAETAETNAETAESNASTSATTATTKASEAVTSASSASTSASTATTKASEASTSATSASTSATTATTKASEATTSASGAATSASTATTKASEASTSATNAATSATAAAASAASIGTDPSFNSVTVTGSTAVKMPVGTTAERPTPVTGQLRYNSTLSAFEGYTTVWGEIGGGGSTDISLNTFTGDGSDVTFSLSAAAAENNTFVYISGVYQNKSTYAVSAADPAVVTFNTAPPNGTAIEIMSAAISVSNIGTPSDNTVSTAKIVNDAVTTAKILDGAVTTAKLASTLSIQDLTVTGTGALKVASGTTAERPTAAAGQFRYNSTLAAFEGYTSEWASLGGVGSEYISATPTLSSSVVNQIVIGNYSSYVNPIFIVKVGSTVIPHTNNAGTLTIVPPASLSGTQTASVEAFDVGKLYSASATVSLEFSALFARYWRITGLVQGATGQPAFYQWFLFPNTGGSGTKMGSGSDITVSYGHSSYNPTAMYVGTSAIAWYLAGHTGTLASQWAQYDLGSAQEVKSMLFNTYSTSYWCSSITIQNSNDGITFTDIKTVTQSSDTNNWTINL